jgi:RNA polymerase sigma-70 factor (ECF subfamily)
VTGTDDSDADLARLSLAGDHRAFARLAERHGPRVARLVRALGVAPADVEDVVQSALVSAWRALADYDRGRPFLGWCLAIAANKARDWNRRNQARQRRIGGPGLDHPEALAAVEPGSGPEVEAERDRLRRVAKAVQALPEQLRLPLVLVAVGGLTQREAGVSLGLTQKTVETRIARARGLLQAALAKP